MLHRWGNVTIKTQVTCSQQVYYLQLKVFRFELAARNTAAEGEFGLRVKEGQQGRTG